LFYLTAPGVRKSDDNRAWLIDKVLALTTLNLNLNLCLTSEGNHMVPSLALLKRKKLKAILDVTTNVVVVTIPSPLRDKLTFHTRRTL
jgi:hypothetical protein